MMRKINIWLDSFRDRPILITDFDQSGDSISVESREGNDDGNSVAAFGRIKGIVTNPNSNPWSSLLKPTGSIEDESVQDLFGSVFESLSSSLVVFDRNLNILLRNQAAKALLPNTPHIVKVLSQITIEGTYIDWPSELRAIIQSMRPRHFDAKMPQDKDRPETYLSIVISPLRVRETVEAVGGLLLADDVSSRISMERRLAVSERLAAVGKLAARVAHELNNPLDGILRFINLAIRRVAEFDDPKATEYLDQAKGGIARMSQIISALLEFSRSTPGAIEQATINKIVEDALSTMEGRAHDTNVIFVCNFHRTDMPVVRGSSLFQVFCNLVKNAIDAMPDSGTLTVTTDIQGPDVWVVFEDTGVGLPESIDKIFEAFYTTKPRGAGTGLGLAVCRDLIQRYGGTITASRRKPRGSRFVVKIPLRNCSASPLEGSSSGLNINKTTFPPHMRAGPNNKK